MSTLREAVLRHPIARRLAPTFDPVRLAADLARVNEAWWSRHAGPYHDGAWESVSLWAPRGDIREQSSKGGEFSATAALGFVPYVASVIDQLATRRNRIRLMRLRPGGRILRHSDPLHTIAPELIRLHVPVVTNPDVWFMVNDKRIVMGAGETWHVDVRFPHEVENRGTTPRVHLVLDLQTTPGLEQLLGAAQSAGAGYLTGYYVKHALPLRLRRLLRISGN